MLQPTHNILKGDGGFSPNVWSYEAFIEYSPYLQMTKHWEKILCQVTQSGMNNRSTLREWLTPNEWMNDVTEIIQYIGNDISTKTLSVNLISAS